MLSLYFISSIDFMLQTPTGTPYINTRKLLFTAIKLQMESENEDAKLLPTIKSTYILQTKDHSRWEWKTILELFTVTLQKRQRVKDILSINSKFIKRLLGFFMPSKGAFINKKWSIDNFIYAKVGYHLIKSLLTFKEGRVTLSISQPVSLK